MNAAFLMTTLLAGADPAPVVLAAPTPNPIALMSAAPIGGCGTSGGCGGGCGDATPKCGACLGTGAADPCKDDNKKPTLFGKIKDHFAKAGKPGDCKVDNCGTNGGCGTAAAAGCNACGTGGLLNRHKHKAVYAPAAAACDTCAGTPVIQAVPAHTPAPVVPLVPVAPIKETPGKEAPKPMVDKKTGVTIPQILAPVSGTRSNF